jgi:hypothetical protein
LGKKNTEIPLFPYTRTKNAVSFSQITKKADFPFRTVAVTGLGILPKFGIHAKKENLAPTK